MHLGRARVEPPAVIARTKVLDDPARIFHLDGLATRIAQVQDTRQRGGALLLLLFALGVFSNKDIGALVTAGVHARRVQHAVLRHDAGERLEERAALLLAQAKVQAAGAAKLGGLRVDLCVVGARQGLDRHELATAVLGEPPHLFFRQNKLRKLRVLPVCVALVVQLVRKHRVGARQRKEALLDVAALQIRSTAQTRRTPPLAFLDGSGGMQRRSVLHAEHGTQPLRELRTHADRSQHGQKASLRVT